MKKKVLIIPLLLLLLSCREQAKDNTVEISLPSTGTVLEGTPRNIPFDLYRSAKIHIAGDKLIVFDDVPKGFFKVLSLSDSTKHYTFGNIGQGPDEFPFIDKECLNVEGSMLSILSRNKLYRYEIGDSSFVSQSSATPANDLLLTSVNPVNNLKYVGNLTYIYNNDIQTSDHEFCLQDLAGNEKRTFGEITDEEHEMETRQKDIHFAKAACANALSGRFAAFYYFRPLFKIFDNKGCLLKTVKIDLPAGEQPGNGKIWFTEPYATPHRLYVLWIGKSKEEVGNDLNSFRPELLVFDWEGNLQQKMTLDKPVITFAVSDTDDTLYAVSFAEEDLNHIYQFRLPAPGSR